MRLQARIVTNNTHKCVMMACELRRAPRAADEWQMGRVSAVHSHTHAQPYSHRHPLWAGATCEADAGSARMAVQARQPAPSHLPPSSGPQDHLPTTPCQYSHEHAMRYRAALHLVCQPGQRADEKAHQARQYDGRSSKDVYSGARCRRSFEGSLRNGSCGLARLVGHPGPCSPAGCGQDKRHIPSISAASCPSRRSAPL